MEEQLIEYVREYDHLFNPHNKDYREHKARREAWEEIGGKIGISGEACKEAWTKLRNAFTNARKRRNTKSGQANKNFPKWKYEDQMSFLIQTLEPRSSPGIVESPSQSYGEVSNVVIKEEFEEDLNRCQTDKNSGDDNDYQEPTVEDRTNGDQQVDGNTSSPKPKYRKKQKLDSSINEIVNFMKDNNRLQAESLKLSENHEIQRDETDMFFLSIASSVKQLSAIEQARVKMEVSNIVFKAQIQELEQQWSSSCHTEMKADFP